jgi:hypothetical protein
LLIYSEPVQLGPEEVISEEEEEDWASALAVRRRGVRKREMGFILMV